LKLPDIPIKKIFLWDILHTVSTSKNRNFDSFKINVDELDPKK